MNVGTFLQVIRDQNDMTFDFRFPRNKADYETKFNAIDFSIFLQIFCLPRPVFLQIFCCARPVFYADLLLCTPSLLCRSSVVHAQSFSRICTTIRLNHLLASVKQYEDVGFAHLAVIMRIHSMRQYS